MHNKSVKNQWGRRPNTLPDRFVTLWLRNLGPQTPSPEKWLRHFTTFLFFALYLEMDYYNPEGGQPVPHPDFENQRLPSP